MPDLGNCPDTSGAVYDRYRTFLRARESGGSASDHPPAMLVLRPGDKVLVTLADDAPPPDTTTAVADALRRHFPGVDFLIVTGITGIAVLPPG